jgi:hypothetical protein
VFTRGHNVVSGMRELSPWRRASRRSWSLRWTAGSPWTTRGGWWSSTWPPSGSLAPPRPGDGPGRWPGSSSPAAAPGTSGRAGPLPGNRRGTVLGQHLELTAVRADGSELPVELSITKVALPGPPVFTACLRDLTGRKQARAEQQAPGKRLCQSEWLQAWAAGRGRGARLQQPARGHPVLRRLRRAARHPRPGRQRRRRTDPGRRRAGRGATRGCSPGLPRCRPPVGSVTRPARHPGNRRGGRHDHRGHRPGTPRPGARHGRIRLARPAATGLIAPGNRGSVGYRANGEAGKRLGAVDATGGIHRSLWGVFLSGCCLAPTPGGRARTGPPCGRDAGRPRGRSWCAGRRRAC